MGKYCFSCAESFVCVHVCVWGGVLVWVWVCMHACVCAVHPTTAVPSPTGVAYDPVFHQVWALHEGQLDLWACSNTRYHHNYIRMQLQSDVEGLGSTVCSLDQTLSILLMYLGMEGAKSHPGRFLEGESGLEAFHRILAMHCKEGGGTLLYALVSALKVCMCVCLRVCVHACVS